MGLRSAGCEYKESTHGIFLFLGRHLVFVAEKSML